MPLSNFKNKNVFAIVLAFLFSTALFSQNKQVYTFQKDDSLQKTVYLAEAKKKSVQTIAALKGNNSKDYRKIYEERFEQVSELIKSSRCVTDIKAQTYLQAVAQKIIRANPELQDLQLRIFFTRDWWPNAYSMGDGTIAINANLLLFMQNEAELAFTLCHELAHFQLDHGGKAIEKYVETVNSKSFQEELKRISKEEFRVNEKLEKLSKGIVFNNRRHSREKEAEADLQGLLFLKKAGYNVAAASTCLQMLGKIDDSLLYKPLELQPLLNFNNAQFNPKWIRKESSIFSQVSKNDNGLTQQEKDSLKTHPDCEKRIGLLNDSIKKYAGSGANFEIDSVEFCLLKKTFFAEITEDTYKQSNLSRNLYYSLQQLQAKENMPLAIYSTTRCLLQMYELQKNHTLGKSIDRESKYLSNDYNLLLRMLSRITLDEIAVLCKAFSENYNDSMKEYADWNMLMQKMKQLNQ